MIRLVIVDDNAGLQSFLEEYFKDNEEVEILYQAGNGEDGLRFIERNKDNIDVILLDLIMPKNDGIWMIDEMKKKQIKVKVLVQSSYNSPEIIQKLSEHGVKYMILKPYEPDMLYKKIKEVNDAEKNIKIVTKKENIEEIVVKMLHELGIPSHIKGFQYIKDSVIFVFKNRDCMGAVTKELYPEIAIKYKTTVPRVERAIRHAIEVSCNRVECSVLHDYFGYSLSYEKSRPTNSEFLTTIADRLKFKVIDEKII